MLNASALDLDKRLFDTLDHVEAIRKDSRTLLGGDEAQAGWVICNGALTHQTGHYDCDGYAARGGILEDSSLARVPVPPDDTGSSDGGISRDA